MAIEGGCNLATLVVECLEDLGVEEPKPTFER